MPQLVRSNEKVYRGIPVSAGVCKGTVLKLGEHREAAEKHVLPDADIPAQIARLENAILQTRRQILEVQKRVSEAMGAQEAGIFEAHLMVLEDPTIIDEVNRVVQNEKVNVEYAFHSVAEKYAATLSGIDDEYLRERAKDMRDVANRVMLNLQGLPERDDIKSLTQPVVIVSEDLAPSMTAQMNRKMVLGFATDMGSKTSHTAILARSLQIPAVVGFQSITRQLQTGDFVLLDGFNGLVIVNPTDQTLFEYGQLAHKKADLRARLEEVHDLPATTLDGTTIVLAANVEQASDTEPVQASGANGVGLYRTEFLFINRDHLPTEEEQFEAYSQVAKVLQPQAVVIRTLDLGGDKFMPRLQLPKEMNPFLGWRAIRFCLQETQIFRVQLRAILRASALGNVHIMYPMISCLDELLQANALLEECKQQLRDEKIPFNEQIPIGVMIEIPSAALIADALAKHVSFFSIGTNDLIQYSMAVDRLNEKIAHLYQPTHPAIVKLIKMTADAAHKNNIWVGVCGEMAGDPTYIPLLLGLGVDEISVAPPIAPQIKYLIRRLKIAEAQKLAQFAMTCESPAEILSRCESFVKTAAPGLFDAKDSTIA
jgi:phosphotransferase system enzyme I (PtsI)